MSTDATYANPAALVSTDWVSGHLEDPHVRLVEVDVDTTAYERGHIQGAAGLNWTTQLGDPIRRDIPSRAAFELLMGQVGVSNDTHLVFYGDNNNWFAAFAYWVARIYRHPRASLMNGGRKKWELEAHELVTEAPHVSATSYHAGEPDVRLRAYLKDVLTVLETGQFGTTLTTTHSAVAGRLTPSTTSSPTWTWPRSVATPLFTCWIPTCTPIICPVTVVSPPPPAHACGCTSRLRSSSRLGRFRMATRSTSARSCSRSLVCTVRATSHVLPMVARLSIAAWASAARSSENDWPIRGRKRPATASASAICAKARNSSGVDRPPRTNDTPRATASSSDTAANEPLAMPNG